MHKHVVKILAVVFIVIGLVCTSGAIFSGVYRVQNWSNVDPVTATITDIVGGYDSDGDVRNSVTVEYDYNGVYVKDILNWYSSDMRIGGSVDLLVNRSDPYDYTAAGFMGWFVTIILMVFGVVFGSIGVVFQVVEMNKRKLNAWLFQYGQPIWAFIEGVDDDWSIQVNGRPMQVLVASYEGMQFRSGAIDNNDIRNLNGEYVRIYVHPKDYNKYVFDFTGMR